MLIKKCNQPSSLCAAELLRRNAEQCLRDMTQLIFMRVPQFAPEGPAAPFSSPPLSLKKRDKQTKKKGAVTAGKFVRMQILRRNAEYKDEIQFLRFFVQF